VLATLILLLTDALSWLFDGMPGPLARFGNYAADTVYYALHAVPTSCYILYADYQLNHDRSRLKKFLKPLAALNVLQAIAALLTPATGILFVIDEANRYSRGFGFPFFAAIQFALALLSFIPIGLGRGKADARVMLTLLSYPLPIVIAAIGQTLVYGFVLVWPATSIFLVAAALNIQHRRGSTDHLTGTANRRSLDETLKNLIKANAATGRDFGGILVDLDEFKSINDRWGHETGDRALEDAAAILRASVRQDDFVARFGGDEFVLLLPGANAASLAEVARRIGTLTEYHNASVERPYTLSFSIGSALYDPASDLDAGVYLGRLDKAMYVDKLARKNR